MNKAKVYYCEEVSPEKVVKMYKLLMREKKIHQINI